MNDDFNTPILIATLFDGVKAVNGAAAGRVTLSAKDLESLQSTFQAFLRDVLGLASEASQNKGEGGGDDAGALLDLLVDMRANAKTNKDWGTADKIRDFLAAQGITIQDGKDGSSWSRG
jgi:cysteinyl-tRNA synthetase